MGNWRRTSQAQPWLKQGFRVNFSLRNNRFKTYSLFSTSASLREIRPWKQQQQLWRTLEMPLECSRSKELRLEEIKERWCLKIHGKILLPNQRLINFWKRLPDFSKIEPVYIPPKVVCTPLALFTAPLDKAPVTGMELTKEDAMLHSPSANISWVASIDFPLAKNDRWNKYLVTLGPVFVRTGFTDELTEYFGKRDIF